MIFKKILVPLLKNMSEVILYFQNFLSQKVVNVFLKLTFGKKIYAINFHFCILFVHRYHYIIIYLFTIYESQIRKIQMSNFSVFCYILKFVS